MIANKKLQAITILKEKKPILKSRNINFLINSGNTSISDTQILPGTFKHNKMFNMSGDI